MAELVTPPPTYRGLEVQVRSPPTVLTDFATDRDLKQWKSLPTGPSSPVQSILALPPLDDERMPEPRLGEAPHQLRSSGHTGSEMISASLLRFALAALKVSKSVRFLQTNTGLMIQIMSVQLISADGSSRTTGLVILLATLIEIKVDSWSFTLPLTGLYLAALGSLLWTEEGALDARQAAGTLVMTDGYQL